MFARRRRTGRAGAAGHRTADDRRHPRIASPIASSTAPRRANGAANRPAHPRPVRRRTSRHRGPVWALAGQQTHPRRQTRHWTTPWATWTTTWTMCRCRRKSRKAKTRSSTQAWIRRGKEGVRMESKTRARAGFQPPTESTHGRAPFSARIGDVSHVCPSVTVADLKAYKI